MDTAPGWHISLVCDCGHRATYDAVVPSLAGDAAERDGWSLLESVGLARPGDHLGLCPGCTAACTPDDVVPLRRVG